MKATYLSNDRWMDTETVAHIYNGILSSYKKECIWVIYKEVNKPRAYYTEWSKSERGKQIPCINRYIWNLERCCWWNYLQVINEDTDIEGRLKEKGGEEEGEGEMNGESIMEAYTLTYVEQKANGDFLYDRELRLGFVTTWWGGRGWEVEGDSRERGHMYIYG